MSYVELINKKWIKVVENTALKFNSTCKEKLIQKRYIERLELVNIMNELNIERATYFRWREEVLTYAALLAAQEGLIRF